jgi:hypothetical protein
MDLKNTWSDIDDIELLARMGNPEALNRLAALLMRLGQPNTGADADGSAGLLISIPLPNTPLP